MVKDEVVNCICNWKGYVSQTSKVEEFGLILAKCPDCGRNVGNVYTPKGRAKFRIVRGQDGSSLQAKGKDALACNGLGH